jgi:FkbM family methyltransferase
VIDIGSNIGYAAANYYFSWRPDKIYCFEPSTYNFSYLQRNLAQFSEIELFNVGISDRSGEANLAMPSLSQNRRLLRKFNNTGLLSIHGESNFKKEKVSLISLDEWAEKKKLNIKDFFIKIDVEGHELFALNGMRAALKNGNVVQIEINPDALAAASCSGKQVHQYFADFGYKPIFAIVPDVLEYESVVSRSILNQTHDVVFAKT